MGLFFLFLGLTLHLVASLVGVGSLLGVSLRLLVIALVGIAVLAGLLWIATIVESQERRQFTGDPGSRASRIAQSQSQTNFLGRSRWEQVIDFVIAILSLVAAALSLVDNWSAR